MNNLCREYCLPFMPFLFIIVFFAACLQNSSNATHVIGEFGLIESFIGRKDVNESIRLVNRILYRENYKLAGDWASGNGNDSSIRVFLVQPSGLPPNTIALSIVEKRFIFIASDWKAQCNGTFGKLGDSTSNPATLAIVLLHEIGHIEKFDARLTDLIPADSLRLLNAGKMINELNADVFAATILKESFCGESEMLKKQLSFLRDALSEHYFDLYDGGISILSQMARDRGKRYGDFSADHPNFNLRFAFMDYYVSPSPEKLNTILYICKQRSYYYPFDPSGIMYLKLLKDSA